MELHPHKNEETGRWTLEGVEPSETTFEKMIGMISSGTNFKFARYGDGEFNCMLGKQGANCDGHEYFPDLGERLKNSFSKKVMTGIQPLALTLHYKDQVLKMVEGLDLYNSDVLHNASIDLQMTRFMKAVLDSGRPHVCVGPSHLTKMFDAIILIDDKNCWLDYEDTKKTLGTWIDSYKNGIIFLCASMMSEVLIKDFEDAEVTIIDAGSVFDPYVGKNSRKYHHKLAI